MSLKTNFTESLKNIHHRITARAKIVRTLTLTPLRLVFNTSALSSLAGKCHLVYIDPGQILFNAGDEGDYVAIISKGAIISDGKPYQRMAGDFVYDIDSSGKRQITARAIITCRIVTIRLSDMSPNESKLVMSFLDPEMIRTALMRTSLLSGLSSSHIDLVAEMVHFRAADRDEIIIKEGDIGQSLLIVERGSAHCQTGFDDAAIPLGDISPGDFVGEIALLMGIPRTATVIASGPMILLELRASDFMHAIDRDGSIEKQIRSRIQTRIMMQFRRYHCPFFETLTDAELTELGSFTNLWFVPAGRKLFRVADTGDIFYMVAYGNVQIQLFSSNLTVRTEILLSAGSHFGELALLHDTPRNGTAMTVTSCLFLTLSRHDFTRIFTDQVCISNSAVGIFKLSSSIDDIVEVMDLLKRPFGREMLARFCEHSMPAANVELWLKCDRFQRQCSKMSVADQATRAKEIISTYISEQATVKVSLPAIAVDELKEEITKDQVDYSRLFNITKYAILRMIAADVYPRFRQSSSYGLFDKGAKDSDSVEDIRSDNEIGFHDTVIKRQSSEGAEKESVA